MLGRYMERTRCRLGRNGRFCADGRCGESMTARYAKRAEARQVARDVAEELADMGAPARRITGTVSTVTVLGVDHDPRCLVARYQQAAETGGDFFPWCTCPPEVRERR